MQHSGEIDSPPYLVGGREFSEIRHFAQNPRGGRKLEEAADPPEGGEN